MRYIYGMPYRGFSPGCQPKSGLIERLDSPYPEFYDLVVYDRVLTDEEVRAYELVPIQKGEHT